MKKTFAILAGMGCAAAFGAQTLAHWTFDLDPLGVKDASGNNRELVNEGVEIVDGAAYFDGTAKVFHSRGILPFFGARNDVDHDVTIECFVKADVVADKIILELGPNANENYGSFFFSATAGAMCRCLTWDSYGGWNGSAYDANPLGDGKWHHLASVIRPTAENEQDRHVFYVDGDPQSPNLSYRNSSPGLMAQRLYIGSRNDSAYVFQGLIDDVRITRGALDTNEFLKVRSAPGTRPVLAHWTFDAADPFADASGNGWTLTGSGVDFSGGFARFVGGSHALSTQAALPFSQCANLTVEYFIRMHSLDDVASGMVIESSPNVNQNRGTFFSVLNDYGTGSISAAVRLPDYHIDHSDAWRVGTAWHHVALVRDISRATDDDGWRLYVDGHQQPQDAQWKNATAGSFTDQVVYLGSRANATSYLNADIDDVRITAAALEPGEFLPARTTAESSDDVIAYWPFAARAPLEDASGNGNLLCARGVEFSKEGAAVLSGEQEQFHSETYMTFRSCRSLTIEFFMKTSMTTVVNVLEFSPLFYASGRTGTFVFCLNEWQADSMEAGFRLDATAEAYNLDWFGEGVADGKWHHIALVYDEDAAATEDVVRLYCDGEQAIGTRPNASAAMRQTFETAFQPNLLFIGSRANAESKFVGELDDIRITGRALDPSEFLTRRSMPPGLSITLR